MQVDRRLIEQIVDEFYQASGSARMAALIMKLEDALNTRGADDKPWHGLTDEERDYFKACGFVGVSRVEEVLRAKNSTLACIPAVPPVRDVEQ